MSLHVPDRWADLKHRLKEASAILDEEVAALLRETHPDDVEGDARRGRRLLAKRSGIELALSYLNEYGDDTAPDPRLHPDHFGHDYPSAFIQWKGTDVCADLTCACGEDFHYDGDFMYRIKCPHCGQVWAMLHTVPMFRIEDVDPARRGAPEHVKVGVPDEKEAD